MTEVLRILVESVMVVFSAGMLGTLLFMLAIAVKNLPRWWRSN